MINNRLVDQTYHELKSVCGGLREDYFGLLYIEREHHLDRERAINQIAFGGNDYGVDGFHFDQDRRNLYIYQFKYSESYSQFKGSMQRLIDLGVQQIFATPNRDNSKNQILLQLRACLLDNRSVIDQIYFRFVFTGNPDEAERSPVLESLREHLEDKRYLIEQFFPSRSVQMVVDFRSSSGRVGSLRVPRADTVFTIPFTESLTATGPNAEQMHLCFIRLIDLAQMHSSLGSLFFDQNIRYGLGQSEAVNKAISRALRQIVIEKDQHPSTFSFNHNGITLYAQTFEKLDGKCRITAPRLLNGAQTVTTVSAFKQENKDNPKFLEGAEVFQNIRVLCKIITNAEQKFVTRVTINNNRQNPVEPWNLHANDMIQLELQDKLREDVKIYYERQENAFDQLSTEDLNDYGIQEDSKAMQMLKLTQTFLLSDGQISRISEMRRVFEDERTYDQVFRQGRLRADSRHIVLCYKIERKLRLLTKSIEEKGQEKYWFVSRARSLLWALLCQGILNHVELESIARNYGSSLIVPAGFTELLTLIATTRVRPLLASLMQDPDYKAKVDEGNLGFLRSDRAFEKCMSLAYEKWGWVHKKLV